MVRSRRGPTGHEDGLTDAFRSRRARTAEAVRAAGAVVALCLLVGTAGLMLVRAPRVNVRWNASASAGDRQAAERRFRLTVERYEGDRTRSYALKDTSATNVRALINDPLVDDTSGIDRSDGVVAPTALNEFVWVVDRIPVIRRYTWMAPGLIALLTFVVVWLFPGGWLRPFTRLAAIVARRLPWDRVEKSDSSGMRLVDPGDMMTPDALRTFVAALWGVSCGMVCALVLVVAMLPDPDGLPVERGKSNGQIAAAEILASWEYTNNPEPREKAFFVATLVLGGIGGYVASRRLAHLRVRPWLLVAATALLPVAAAPLVRSVLAVDRRGSQIAACACLVLVALIARRWLRLLEARHQRPAPSG